MAKDKGKRRLYRIGEAEDLRAAFLGGGVSSA